jgi:hypothetical protein
MKNTNFKIEILKYASNLKCMHPKFMSMQIQQDQNIRIYNSLTKKKEKLILDSKQAIYWYSCGPTVYDSAHIGHAWLVVKKLTALL